MIPGSVLLQAPKARAGKGKGRGGKGRGRGKGRGKGKKLWLPKQKQAKAKRPIEEGLEPPAKKARVDAPPTPHPEAQAAGTQEAQAAQEAAASQPDPPADVPPAVGPWFL